MYTFGCMYVFYVFLCLFVVIIAIVVAVVVVVDVVIYKFEWGVKVRLLKVRVNTSSYTIFRGTCVSQIP